MSSANQKQTIPTTTSAGSTAAAATGSAGRPNRRVNPFGPGKSSTQAERKEKPSLPRGGAIPKDVTKVQPAEMADDSDNGDNSCVVCFKVVAIYSVGECDHPVCYECSTRMRVLCEQNECPICRANLSKVIFSPEVLSYRQLEIKNRTGLYDKKYRICFATAACQESYNKLLEHPCSMCSLGPFATFVALRDHVKKKHEQFYCDICTDNLSVFSFERRSYSRTDLGLHRRKGDVDDKSHRGHPLCEYCDLRYFDRDELFKHLRREHFYCHFCDADGANCYYADYAALRVHFKAEHYLCEEGDCAEEQFTAVFRTEIDLRAHNVNMHGQGLSRQAAKQGRTLELEINLAPRSRNGPSEEGAGRGFTSTYRHRDTQNEFDNPEQQRQRNAAVFTAEPQVRVIDARNEQEFPSLGGSSGTTTTFTLRPGGPLIPRSYGTGGIARTQENFPALGGGAASASTPSTSGSYRQGPASAILKKPGAKTVIHVSNRPNAAKKPETKSGQDFPSLSGGAPAKSKKSASLFLDEDFVPLPSSNFSSNIASKHRSLANGYEAFAADATAKLGLVKLAEAAQHVPKKPIDSAPKLNSSHMFPTLGNAPSAAMAAQWVSLGKKTPVESRKSKVAPAPLSSATSNKTSAKPTAIASTSKKEPTKPKPTEKPSSAPAANAKQQKKVKNYNPFEDDNDEDVYVPSASVMSAMSAKHRSLVDSYESVVKPTTNKLALVTRPDAPTTASNTKQASAPKLSSKDNFPSLSAGSSVSAAKNGPTINFLDIMKASNGSTVDVQNNNGKKTVVASNNNNDGRVGNLNGPPPGFGGGGGAAAPPPGFKSVTLNSVAKSSNDLTFTTSLGEQYSILPTTSSTTQYQYLPPNNSAKRNQALFAHFQSIITDPQVVDSFKQVSQMYINGAYKAQPYYEHCQVALADKFEVIFPELLVLLPDINKQQQLYQVHNQMAPKTTGTAKSKSKKQNNNAGLEVCATCRQVLNSHDLQTHLQSHSLANNFPSLSTASSGAVTSSAWKNQPSAGCAPVNVSKVIGVAAAEPPRLRCTKPKSRPTASEKRQPLKTGATTSQQNGESISKREPGPHNYSSLTLIGGVLLAGLLLWTALSAVWRKLVS